MVEEEDDAKQESVDNTQTEEQEQINLKKEKNQAMIDVAKDDKSEISDSTVRINRNAIEIPGKPGHYLVIKRDFENIGESAEDRGPEFIDRKDKVQNEIRAQVLGRRDRASANSKKTKGREQRAQERIDKKWNNAVEKEIKFVQMQKKKSSKIKNRDNREQARQSIHAKKFSKDGKNSNRNRSGGDMGKPKKKPKPNECSMSEDIPTLKRQNSRIRDEGWQDAVKTYETIIDNLNSNNDNEFFGENFVSLLGITKDNEYKKVIYPNPITTLATMRTKCKTQQKDKGLEDFVRDLNFIHGNAVKQNASSGSDCW